MSDVKEISAVIYFLRPDEGGRNTPIFSGYRPAFYFGDKQTDGAVVLEGAEMAMPGEERQAKIKLLHPEYLDGELRQGSRFEVKEGLKVIGRGQVLSVGSGETQVISNEELERLRVQITEYYRLYFSELRRQLERSDLYSEAVPEFLKGYKRVITVLGRDGVVVAHFPAVAEITMHGGDGTVLFDFPSEQNGVEDLYEFLVAINDSTRDIVIAVSGGEDPEIGISPGVSWGVKGLTAPQQKIRVIDAENVQFAWQAPWTRITVADSLSLNFWEDTERARTEAREDLEPYISTSDPCTEVPIYKGLEEIGLGPFDRQLAAVV